MSLEFLAFYKSDVLLLSKVTFSVKFVREAVKIGLSPLADPGGGVPGGSAPPYPPKFKAPDIQIKWL